MGIQRITQLTIHNSIAGDVIINSKLLGIRNSRTRLPLPEDVLLNPVNRDSIDDSS
jgi:hypothetical protein